MDDDKTFGILNINHSRYKTRLSKSFIDRKPYKPADPGIIVSFIPGTVIDILVSGGQEVSQGDDLIILDAMKMQNRLKSPVGGQVEEILVNKGDKVSKGTHLIVIR